jgi:hypothetical protein
VGNPVLKIIHLISADVVKRDSSVIVGNNASVLDEDLVESFKKLIVNLVHKCNPAL